MADWIKKLDEFLKLSEHDVLAHAGSVTHEQALEKASAEYEKFQQVMATLPSKADIDFEKAIKRLPARPRPKS